ncbi:tubulin polyglutamylase complex subunit 1-like [Centruroides sculpturatus]|uniref:tubulin polyglutamylase complex subunit 1-like n=1 Tax=Centruroides sculpturatus TaxID=218467 RepID=UPI000C6D354B|nr:tubulin polyglutamylase complex subunit 1-like [Centruroides sculpturatus]
MSEEENVETVLHQALLLLLDNKPKDPISFLANHFQRECEKSNRVSQAAQFLENSNSNHPSIEEKLCRAYHTISQYKIQQELRGLTGDIYTDLLVQLLTGLPERQTEVILQKLQCSYTEYVPFGIFHTGVLFCLQLKEYVQIARSLFQDLDEKHCGQVSRTLCKTVLDEINQALKITNENPKKVFEIAQKLSTNHLADKLICAVVSIDEDDDDMMKQDEFLNEAVNVFLQMIPKVK